MTNRHHSIAPMHPGELLKQDVLPNLEISTSEFARRLGLSRQMIYDILNEKKPVSAETAVKLGALLGGDGRLWLNLQRTYDFWKAEQEVDVSNIQSVA